MPMEIIWKFQTIVRCKTVIHAPKRTWPTHTYALGGINHTSICAFPVSARMFRWSIFKCAVSVWFRPLSLRFQSPRTTPAQPLSRTRKPDNWTTGQQLLNLSLNPRHPLGYHFCGCPLGKLCACKIEIQIHSFCIFACPAERTFPGS